MTSLVQKYMAQSTKQLAQCREFLLDICKPIYIYIQPTEKVNKHMVSGEDAKCNAFN